MNLYSDSTLPSERRFGRTITGAFAFLGLYGIFAHRSRITCAVCLLLSVVCGVITYAQPKALAPLNKAWFHLGDRMGKIVSPIVLAIIFFGILTPIAIVAKLFGRDPLRLKPGARQSYWIKRDSQSSATSFKNQF
jgi:hypothetical protein